MRARKAWCSLTVTSIFYLVFGTSCATPFGKGEATKSIPNREIDCTDQVDNDQDAFTDCRDPDCDSDLSCHASPIPDADTNCGNLEDDDHDGNTDCKDDNCGDHPRVSQHHLHSNCPTEAPCSLANGQ